MKKFIFVFIPLFFIIACSKNNPETMPKEAKLEKLRPIDISECVKPDKLVPSCNMEGMPKSVDYFKQIVDCSSIRIIELTNYSRDLRVYSQCLEDVVRVYNEGVTHKFIFSKN